MPARLKVFRQLGPESACGYPLLAASGDRTELVSMARDHVVVTDVVSGEERGWLADDFQATTASIAFDARAIMRRVREVFGVGGDASVLVRVERRRVRALEFTFGRRDACVEVTLRKDGRRWMRAEWSADGTAHPDRGATLAEVGLVNEVIEAVAPVLEWSSMRRATGDRRPGWVGGGQRRDISESGRSADEGD